MKFSKTPLTERIGNVWLSLLTGLVAGVGMEACAAESETILVRTMQAQMKFDQAEIAVEPGAKIKLVLENIDDLPHNIVFFKPGTDVVAVSNKQMEKPEEALKRNWLPDDPRVWLNSRMLNPKEKQELEFTAPTEPGVYPYMCSFPGHVLTMQGKLVVQKKGPILTSSHFAVYLGNWDKLPDFNALKPHREGELPDNLIQLKFDDYKNQYGAVFEGKLAVGKEGEYEFQISSDDGSRLSVDGKKVVEYDRIHPSSEIKSGKVKLKPGEHDVRVEYFQGGGNAELYVAWKGPDFSITPLSLWLHPAWKGGASTKKKSETTGMPLPVGNEPVVYRNFIEGAGNRGIGVGYPGGMSLAWSAESMNLALVWRGAFIDAARHWTNRGGGHQPALGYDTLSLVPVGSVSLAVQSAPDSPWPTVAPGQKPEGFSWKGYRLDSKRQPEFQYEWKGVRVRDRIEVSGDATKGNGRMERTVSLSGAVPAGTLFLVGETAGIKKVEDGFELSPALKVRAEGAELRGNRLVVPVGAGKSELKITYAWKELPGKTEAAR
jgi:plastocyanin